MDPVTHTLLGATTGYALFGRRLGRRAAGVGALAAFVPDADVFIRSAADPLLAIEFHRQFTHALSFSLVGSLIVAALWFVWPKFRAQWRPLWGCAWVAYLTHCLLDAATTYGTQLFWPFSSYRAGWNLIAIVDPVFTLALAGGLIAALSCQRQTLAGAGLAFAMAYLALGGVQHIRAAAAQVLLAQQRGHTVARSTVMPTLGNNIVWRSLYECQGRIHADRIRVGWFSAATALEGTSLPRESVGSLTPEELEQNHHVRAFERFAWFSDHWVARSPFEPAVLGDMRYSRSPEAFDPIWGIRFTELGADTNYVWVNRVRDRKLELGKLWDEIRGVYPGYRPLPAHL